MFGEPFKAGRSDLLVGRDAAQFADSLLPLKKPSDWQAPSTSKATECVVAHHPLLCEIRRSDDDEER